MTVEGQRASSSHQRLKHGAGNGGRGKNNDLLGAVGWGGWHTDMSWSISSEVQMERHVQVALRTVEE